MFPIIILAGVGVIAAVLTALFLTLVIGIQRGDHRPFGQGPETMASRILLTGSLGHSSAASEDDES